MLLLFQYVDKCLVNSERVKNEKRISVLESSMAGLKLLVEGEG